MRYMIIVKGPENPAAGPPPQKLMQAIAELGQEAAKAGVFVQMGGLLPTAMGSRMRLARGQISITDGPFTEAKEVIGGFAIYQVPSKDEAIGWTKRFLDLHKQHWPGWEGECEIRQMFDAPPGA